MILSFTTSFTDI